MYGTEENEFVLLYLFFPLIIYIYTYYIHSIFVHNIIKRRDDSINCSGCASTTSKETINKVATMVTM